MSNKTYGEPKEIFFSSTNSHIRVIGSGTNSLFNIIDLSSKLNYHSANYLKQYYCVKTNDVKIYNHNYIDFDGVSNILNRAIKPNSKELLGEIISWVGKSQHLIVPARIEIDILKSIKDYFDDDETIEVISQLKVGKFLPDIVVKKNNEIFLIIEINEHNHSFCEKRMKSIKKKLNCDNFMNVNPHDPKFSTGKLLKKIIKFIK